MTRIVALVSLLAAAACGGGMHADDDDDGGVVDGGMSSITFRVSSSDLGIEQSNTTVTQVKMHLHDVRATADTGTIFTDPTDIDLAQGDVSEIEFHDAPPGQYSAFKFELERPSDSDYAWKMNGTTQLNGDPYTFEVEDDQSLQISVDPLDLALGAGQNATVEVDLQVNPVLAPVDWSQASLEGTQLELHDGSSQMAGIRTRVQFAFTVGSVQVSYGGRARPAQSALAMR